MTFTNPLGLLALLAVPAVLVLHLFRRRLAERRVAALFLFADDLLVAEAGRKRTRLLQTASLWLELLAALCLALWLAGLSFGGTPARHLVVVLDDSASMGANGTHQRAVRAVQERVAGLGGADLLTVLRTGPQPTIAVGPRARAEAAAPALAAWRPSRARHDLQPTLQLARELARDGEVVLVTDAAPTAGLDDVTWIACGEPLANRAVLDAERRARPDGGDVVVARVAAFGTGASAPAVVTLFDGDHAVAQQPLAFHDGIAEVSLPAPADSAWLRLQLPTDALAIDDVVWLPARRSRPVRVANLLDGAEAEALQWSRLFAALPECEAVEDPRRAQLLVSAKPGALLPGQTELVVATEAAPRLLATGPFVVDRAHDWLRGVQLDGVRWCFEHRLLPGRGLVTAGNETLASEEFVDVGRRLWLSLDPAAGNFVRSPSWPILVANVVEACRLDAPGPAGPVVLLHEEARYRREDHGGPDAHPVLIGPDGSRRVLPADPVVAFVPETIGLHRLVGDGDAPLATFAARFLDAQESDLSAGVTVQRAATARDDADERAAIARDTGFERRLLALLALALLLCDWRWALRRST